MRIPEFIYRRQAVAENQRRMEKINDYFRTEGRPLDLPKILQIKQIISQNMDESDQLIHQMRRLENVYHPLQTQLTFR